MRTDRGDFKSLFHNQIGKQNIETLTSKVAGSFGFRKHIGTKTVFSDLLLSSKVKHLNADDVCFEQM